MAVAFLPACGSKNNVKSEKAPETVLNPEETPLATVSGEKPKSSRVHHAAKIAKSVPGIQTPVIVGTPSSSPMAAQTTPQVSMDTTTPVQTRGHFHWFLWLLVLLAIGAIGWYFWSKNQERINTPTQPMPPSGGLSPVSGFTALKEHIQDEPDLKPSFWSKKIF